MHLNLANPTFPMQFLHQNSFRSGEYEAYASITTPLQCAHRRRNIRFILWNFKLLLCSSHVGSPYSHIALHISQKKKLPITANSLDSNVAGSVDIRGLSKTELLPA